MQNKWVHIEQKEEIENNSNEIDKEQKKKDIKIPILQQVH